jgi:hypothetical protein
VLLQSTTTSRLTRRLARWRAWLLKRLEVSRHITNCRQPAALSHRQDDCFLEYDRLVNQTFGPSVYYCQPPAPPSSSTCPMGWYYAAGKVPARAVSSPQLVQFVYVFPLGVSPLRLMPSWFQVKPYYWYLVTINDRVVACNRGVTSFLMTYDQAWGAGPMGCTGPL